jgi:hypothetical protein
MSVKNREIDENGYVIIEPLTQLNIDKKADLKTYNRYYHREYYKKFLSVKVEWPLCGCSITKEKFKRH